MSEIYRVGKTYSVPCVFHRNFHLPVLLPLHADPELGSVAKHPHYHFDWRFIPKSTMKAVWGMTDFRRLFGYVAWAVRFEHGEALDQPLPLEYVRKRCLRPMPDFPREWDYHVNGTHLRPLVKSVETLCKGKCIRNLENPVCPHKGISLAGLPVDADGCVICPGHGLKWNLQTGELVTYGEGITLKQSVQLGDTIVIEDDYERHETEVQSIYPSGAFCVHWYFGQNRYNSELPGHWFCEFAADGSPLHETTHWRIIEHRPRA